MRGSWFLVGALIAASSPAFATGSVECQGKTRDGVAVTFQWGTTRGFGSARISPYTLTVGNEKPSLAELEEVGYWVGEGKVLVRLIDPKQDEPQILLMTELWKDGAHGGVLTLGKPTVPVPMKIVVRCDMG